MCTRARRPYQGDHRKPYQSPGSPEGACLPDGGGLRPICETNPEFCTRSNQLSTKET